jgi:uncharacterized protein (TIGR02266 family)
LSHSNRRYRRLTVSVHVEYASDVTGLCCELATTLGAGGLFIRSDQPLPRGARLKMRFQLPGCERLHEIEGRVVWSRPPAEEDPHAPGMGVQFTDRHASTLLAHDLEAME